MDPRMKLGHVQTNFRPQPPLFIWMTPIWRCSGGANVDGDEPGSTVSNQDDAVQIPFYDSPHDRRNKT